MNSLRSSSHLLLGLPTCLLAFLLLSSPGCQLNTLLFHLFVGRVMILLAIRHFCLLCTSIQHFTLCFSMFSSAVPPTFKNRIPNSHRRLSSQRCSTNCQGQVFQFTPKTFVPALLHQLSRTGFPIRTKDFRSSAAPPTVKDRFSNSHRRLPSQRCSTNCQRQDLQFTPKTFSPSAAPPTVKDGISNSHRRLSCQRCSTNCQGHVLQFTPKTFVPALLHQLFKDMISNSHRRLSFQRCSTNCQGQDLQFTPKTFAPALPHQLSRTGSPIHTEDFRPSAAPPTVKDRISNSHRRLSLPALLHQLSRTGSPIHTEDFRPALLHQLSRTSSPIHTEDFRPSAGPPIVKDRFSNSHRRLSFQRCSTNCQGRDLQFTPKTFVPALLHQLSKGQGLQFTPKTFVQPLLHHSTVKDRFSNSHRRLSSQCCSTNC